jgi:hypothetical protein
LDAISKFLDKCCSFLDASLCLNLEGFLSAIKLLIELLAGEKVKSLSDLASKGISGYD